MLTSATCLKVIGDPKLEHEMKPWFVEPEFRINAVPVKIYCNTRLPPALRLAFQNIIKRGIVDRMKMYEIEP